MFDDPSGAINKPYIWLQIIISIKLFELAIRLRINVCSSIVGSLVVPQECHISSVLSLTLALVVLTLDSRINVAFEIRKLARETRTRLARLDRVYGIVDNVSNVGLTITGVLLGDQSCTLWNDLRVNIWVGEWNVVSWQR